MNHFRLPGGCEGGSCPKVAEVDGGMLAVQGRIVDDPELIARMRPGEGETVILLPGSMFDQAQAERS
jgi:hypothetical protein